jgi:hypothetical protein
MSKRVEKYIIIPQVYKADLNKIIKYHPASKFYLNSKTCKHYETTIERFVVYITKNKAPQITSEFDLDRIFATYIPKSVPLHEYNAHVSNLLVIVKHMIEHEWSYYAMTTVAHTEAVDILEQMLNLAECYNNKECPNLPSEFTFKFNKPKSDNNTSYRKLEVYLTTDYEKLQQIRFLFEILQVRLNEKYPFLPIQDLLPLRMDIETIQKAIKVMKLPFKKDSAYALFCKYVIEVLKKYLNAEIDWNSNAEINQDQSQIIYGILLNFNLLPVSKPRTVREKSNYIQSLFRTKRMKGNTSFFKFS